MIIALELAGTAAICLGSAVAVLAERLPARRTRLQYCGGGFILGGVTLIGLAAPMI